MVVDGSQQLVGGDASALSKAVATATHASKLQIEIKDVQRVNGSVHFSVHASPGPNATLVAALAENATRSEVARGENAGRTLHHVAVVRTLREFDSKAVDGRPLQFPYPGLSGAAEPAGPLRLVVFLADRKTGHVLAVAEQTIDR
jgi:hypothetical protein